MPARLSDLGGGTVRPSSLTETHSACVSGGHLQSTWPYRQVSEGLGPKLQETAWFTWTENAQNGPLPLSVAAAAQVRATKSGCRQDAQASSHTRSDYFKSSEQCCPNIVSLRQRTPLNCVSGRKDGVRPWSSVQHFQTAKPSDQPAYSHGWKPGNYQSANRPCKPLILIALASLAESKSPYSNE